MDDQRKKALEEVTLTVEEVALILKISNKAVYSRISRNRLPGVVRSGKSIRFNSVAFYGWLNACVVMPERIGL